jgi:hypothetical protein
MLVGITGKLYLKMRGSVSLGDESERGSHNCNRHDSIEVPWKPYYPQNSSDQRSCRNDKSRGPNPDASMPTLALDQVEWSDRCGSIHGVCRCLRDADGSRSALRTKGLNVLNLGMPSITKRWT